MAEKIGKLTPQQITADREARAAREEVVRRICEEMLASSSTFEDAASHLDVPVGVVRYFQADRLAGSHVDLNDDSSASWRRRAVSVAIKLVEAAKRKRRTILLCGGGVVALAFILSLFLLHRYEIRNDGLWVIRFDRFTGDIEWCHPRGGCTQ